jgi:hypothetical protein
MLRSSFVSVFIRLLVKARDPTCIKKMKIKENKGENNVY